MTSKGWQTAAPRKIVTAGLLGRAATGHLDAQFYTVAIVPYSHPLSSDNYKTFICCEMGGGSGRVREGSPNCRFSARETRIREPQRLKPYLYYGGYGTAEPCPDGLEAAKARRRARVSRAPTGRVGSRKGAAAGTGVPCPYRTGWKPQRRGDGHGCPVPLQDGLGAAKARRRARVSRAPTGGGLSRDLTACLHFSSIHLSPRITILGCQSGPGHR